MPEPKTVNRSDEQELCEAVAAWLSYKSLTGLSGHLNEGSIGVPIAEYLTTRFNTEVKSEQQHPMFKSPKRGRPKQVDFVRAKNRGNDWHSVYECKYQEDTAHRLIADICRLTCLAQTGERGRPRRYFVLAGKRKRHGEPIDRLINANGRRISVFQDILLRDPESINKPKTVKLNSLAPSQIRYFEDFARENDVRLSSSMVTELVGFALAGSYACSVWELKSSKGSKLLNADEIAKLAA